MSPLLAFAHASGRWFNARDRGQNSGESRGSQTGSDTRCSLRASRCEGTLHVAHTAVLVSGYERVILQFSLLIGVLAPILERNDGSGIPQVLLPAARRKWPASSVTTPSAGSTAWKASTVAGWQVK